MTGGRGYAFINLLVIALSIGALIVAFVVPSGYVAEAEQSMSYHTRKARNAIMAGDMQSAESSIEELYAEFQQRQHSLKLICHHDDIDEMEKCITCCRDLAKLEQSDNLICELDELKQILEHIHSVEHPDIYEVF